MLCILSHGIARSNLQDLRSECFTKSNVMLDQTLLVVDEEGAPPSVAFEE